MTVPLISPGVHVREIDLTTIVPRVSTTEGAFAGVFRWGPVGQRVLVDREVKLASLFGQPKNFNQESWFTAAAFLAYGNRLYISRAANTTGKTPQITANVESGNDVVTLATGNTSALQTNMYVIDGGDALAFDTRIETIINSTAFTIGDSDNALANSNNVGIQFVSNSVFSAVGNSGPVANLEFQLIKNEDHFEDKDGNFDTDVQFVARYPGALGNSLRVSVCGNADGFSSQINLQSYAETAKLTVETGSNTAAVELTGSANGNVSSNATTLSGLFNVTDLVEVGNTFLGTQFMKITAVSDQENFGVTANTYDIDTVSGNTSIETDNTSGIAVGMKITDGPESVNNRIVETVVNTTVFTVDEAPTANLTTETVTISPRTTFDLSFVDDFTLSTDFEYSSENEDQYEVPRRWEFYNLVDEEPGQSDYVINFGNSAINNDELHVVVVDEGGKFTGIPGTVLETFRSVSRATDAKSVDGQNNYWRDRVNDASTFIYAVNDLSNLPSAEAEDLIDSTLDVSSTRLKLGRDGEDENNIPIGVLTNAWDYFKSKEDVDVAILLQGKARSSVLANYLIDNIAEKRKDCVVCVSPQRGDVVNNEGFEADAVVSFRNVLRSSSYGIMDSGYKYLYDRYNDLFRWVPLCGDVGGLMVRTDFTNAPWFSPAGFNRGQIKNVFKLAFNPRLAERDTLYKAGVNPVTSFPGRGTVLFGDKTMLAKPSAFNRINVRRLFIVLEKAISKASEFMLFEFNDEFTRSQFKNLVVPYLRDVQGRRGITDFVVVCDETNNTPEVIDRNEFIGDIYIKPARSINFIQLNFVAVRTGASFSSVINTF